MATKTITIDVEAYRRLKSAKAKGESFSRTIKRVLPPPFDWDDWMRRVRECRMSPEAIEAVEDRIRSRRAPAKKVG